MIDPHTIALPVSDRFHIYVYISRILTLETKVMTYSSEMGSAYRFPSKLIDSHFKIIDVPFIFSEALICMPLDNAYRTTLGFSNGWLFSYVLNMKKNLAIISTFKIVS